MIVQEVKEQIADVLGGKTLPANPDHRGFGCTLNREQGVKISIERDDDSPIFPSPREDHRIRGRSFGDLSEVDHVQPPIPQECGGTPRQILIEQNPHRSIGKLFGAIVNRGCRVQKHLTDRLLIEARIILQDLVPILVLRQDVEHPLHREPRSADAGLPVHHCGIDGDSLERH